MKFEVHHHHHPSPTPEWVARLLRNDEIIQAQLDLLLARPPAKLSPEDQAALNAIYNTATKDSAKIDAAQK